SGEVDIRAKREYRVRGYGPTIDRNPSPQPSPYGRGSPPIPRHQVRSLRRQSMTKYTDIGVETHGHVGLIEIRKPPLNFFDISLINQIADALEEFDKDIEIRASVLAAQGKAFCAGANFNDPKRQEQEAREAKGDPADSLGS